MSLLQTALAYAARGWAVAPLHSVVNGSCSCGKGCDEKTMGKHPRLQHGIKEASKDPAQIRVWWTKWPDANIALACGPSNVWALDIDADRDGLETLALLQQRFGDLRTWMQRSGRGGLHLVFKMPADARNFRQGSDHLKLDGLKLEGLDTRTGNGYILLAPSVNSGGAYEILEDMEPVEAPAWLWNIVAPPPAAPPTRVEIATIQPDSGDSAQRRVCLQEILPRACADIESAQATGQSRHKLLHDKAHKLGGYVASGYLQENEVSEALVQAGINAGKPEKEVRRTVEAGLKVGMAKPRTLEVKAGKEEPRASREEVLAWWDANPENSSNDVARVWGVPATTLRRWQFERRSVSEILWTLS